MSVDNGMVASRGRIGIGPVHCVLREATDVVEQAREGDGTEVDLAVVFRDVVA